MAYTTPTTRSAGYVVTAGNWNTDMVDNIKFLHDPPSCRVYNNAAISIPNNTDTALTFNNERFDTDSIHSTSSNTGRLTSNTTGKYLITGHVDWGTNTTGRRALSIWHSGVGAIIANIQAPPDATTGLSSLSVSTVYQMNVSDYVELRVLQTSGGALNVTSAANYSPEFGMVWVSG